SAVTCSQIFDNGTNVGIGTITPTAKTEISHSDLNPGAFALRLTNLGNTTNAFTETGIAFNLGVGNNPNFYAARIYSKYDGNSVGDGRISMQLKGNSGLQDVLSVKFGRVGINT